MSSLVAIRLILFLQRKTTTNQPWQRHPMLLIPPQPLPTNKVSAVTAVATSNDRGSCCHHYQTKTPLDFWQQKLFRNQQKMSLKTTIEMAIKRNAQNWTYPNWLSVCEIAVQDMMSKSPYITTSANKWRMCFDRHQHLMLLLGVFVSTYGHVLFKHGINETCIVAIVIVIM